MFSLIFQQEPAALPERVWMFAEVFSPPALGAMRPAGQRKVPEKSAAQAVATACSGMPSPGDAVPDGAKRRS